MKEMYASEIEEENSYGGRDKRTSTSSNQKNKRSQGHVLGRVGNTTAHGGGGDSYSSQRASTSNKGASGDRSGSDSGANYKPRAAGNPQDFGDTAPIVIDDDDNKIVLV